MLNMSPLMLAQMALDRPELVAQMMAARGKAPPTGRPQLLPGEQGGPPAPQAAAPAPAPQLSPMPAPTEIAPLPMPPAVAQAVPPAAAAPVATAATPGAGPQDALAAAIGGLAPSAAGGGQQGRVAQAPAPFIQGALNPQLAVILANAIQQAQSNTPPALSQFLAR